jgi:hypothetical protein
MVVLNRFYRSPSRHFRHLGLKALWLLTQLFSILKLPRTIRLVNSNHFAVLATRPFVSLDLFGIVEPRTFQCNIWDVRDYLSCRNVVDRLAFLVKTDDPFDIEMTFCTARFFEGGFVLCFRQRTL